MIFKKNEKGFILTCLAALFLLVIFLCLDVSRVSEIRAGGRGRIGAVVHLDNDVRRRASSGTAWEGLARGSPVMDADTIATGFDSSAGVALGDGSLVDMCEDSMLTFDRSGDGAVLSIEKGCAGIRRSGEGTEKNNDLVIVAGSQRIALREGDLSIVRPRDKEPEAFVRRGKARVILNGVQRTIEQDELAVLRHDALVVEKKKLVLAEPSENRRFFTSQDDARVEFAWSYSGERYAGTEYILEVSNNRSFAPIEKRILSEDETATASMPAGGYFWRVTVDNHETGTRDTSETRRFAVLRDGPVALLAPPDGATIVYGNGLPLLAFTWEPHRLASSYLLEISEQADFSNTHARIASRVVNLSHAWDRNLRPGETVTLHWRVTAQGGPQGWQGRRSEPRRFIVKRGAHVEPPRLVYPGDGKSMSRTKAGRERVIFSWDNMEEDLKRRIMFSRDKDFSSMFRAASLDTDSWTMRQSFPSGRYFWRVGLYDRDGNRRALSDARMFELREYDDLALVSPADGAEFAVDEIEKGLRFRWERPELKGRFLFEMSDEREFRNVKKAITTDSTETTIDRAGAGNKFWRVRLLDDDNRVAAASGMRAFSVREGMEPPAVIFPRAGGAVTMLTENELKFSWKPSRGAKAYQFELHQLVNEKNVTRDRLVLSTQTEGTAYTVSDLNLLDVGNFYWTIRAVKKDRRNRVVSSSKKVRNNFNINLGDSKIIIVSPDIQVIENDDGR